MGPPALREEGGARCVDLMPRKTNLVIGPVVGWRAWFDEWVGAISRFNSRDLDWSDLPKDGMLALRTYYKPLASNGLHYADILSGNTSYFRVRHPSGDDVYGSNDDPVERNERRYSGAVIIEGRWTTKRLIDLAAIEATHADGPP